MLDIGFVVSLKQQNLSCDLHTHHCLERKRASPLATTVAGNRPCKDLHGYCFLWLTKSHMNLNYLYHHIQQLSLIRYRVHTQI